MVACSSRAAAARPARWAGVDGAAAWHVEWVVCLADGKRGKVMREVVGTRWGNREQHAERVVVMGGGVGEVSSPVVVVRLATSRRAAVRPRVAMKVVEGKNAASPAWPPGTCSRTWGHERVRCVQGAVEGVGFEVQVFSQQTPSHAYLASCESLEPEL